jgi:hypothetical protein
MGSVGDVWFFLFAAGPVLGLVLGAAGLVVAARGQPRISLRLAVAIAAAVLSGAIVGFATIGDVSGGIPLLVVGAWRLAIPAAVAIVLLRHQLFDLDAKLKITISRSTLAGVFLAVFFSVEQLIQGFTNQLFGIVGGALVAGLLIFAFAPVQRIVERMAHVAVKERSPLAPQEAYAAAVEMAASDGPLTRVEEKHLAKIATRLGIDPEMAFDLREAAMARVAASAA